MLSGCEHLTALNHAFASIHVSQWCGLKKVQIRMKRWHSKKHIASENFLDVRVLFSRFRNDESNRRNLRSGTGSDGRWSRKSCCLSIVSRNSSWVVGEGELPDHGESWVRGKEEERWVGIGQRLRALYGNYGWSKRQKKIVYDSAIGLRSSEKLSDSESGGIAKESQRQSFGAKRNETQKKRHNLGNGTNMCKRNGGICLIVEVFDTSFYGYPVYSILTCFAHGALAY